MSKESECFLFNNSMSSMESLVQRINEVEGSLWHFRGELVEWKKKIESLMGQIGSSLGL